MSRVHDHGGAEHRALLYHEPSEFVDGVRPFVHEGLREGEHVLAAVTREKLAWLREDLGADADEIELLDTNALYDRHGSMFRQVLGHLDRHARPDARGLRIVAEQALARREPVDVRAYMRYEAVSNLAYAEAKASVLCPYDASRLPDEILRAALQTHPEVLENGRPRRSELFMDPRTFVRSSVRHRAAPSDSPSLPIERAGDIGAARALAEIQAEARGLARQAVTDLAVAVSEVAANALLHGEAPRRLWVYVEDGHLICQVRDAGPGLPDPVAGYLPGDSQSLNGHGLWLAHQFCDVVDIASDASATDVYLRMRLPQAR